MRPNLKCGVYCTKFELILKVTLTNRTRGARGDLKQNRTLHDEFRHSPASAPRHCGAVPLRFCCSVSALIPIAFHAFWLARDFFELNER